MSLKKVVPMYNKADYEKLAKEYEEISSQIKALETRKKALADLIKKGAEQMGVKDDKGSFYLEVDNYVLGKVACKSMKINQEQGVTYLRDKGLDECVKVETVVTVDEDMLEKAIMNNKITLDEVNNFTEVKVSYKVSSTKKEVMPEVEQSNLSVAKRK